MPAGAIFVFILSHTVNACQWARRRELCKGLNKGFFFPHAFGGCALVLVCIKREKEMKPASRPLPLPASSPPCLSRARACMLSRLVPNKHHLSSGLTHGNEPSPFPIVNDKYPHLCKYETKTRQSAERATHKNIYKYTRVLISLSLSLSLLLSFSLFPPHPSTLGCVIVTGRCP